MNRGDRRTATPRLDPMIIEVSDYDPLREYSPEEEARLSQNLSDLQFRQEMPKAYWGP